MAKKKKASKKGKPRNAKQQPVFDLKKREILKTKNEKAAKPGPKQPAIKKTGTVEKPKKEKAKKPAGKAKTMPYVSRGKASKDEGDFLETPIDELYQLIEKRNKINVKEASKIFKVPEDRIEEWGEILEEHGMIDMVYPAIGRPLLRKKGCTNKPKKVSK